MILVFRTRQDRKVQEIMTSIIRNFKEKLNPELKKYMIQDVNYMIIMDADHAGYNLIILEMKLFIQPLPKIFFYMMLKRSFRKKGYTGEMERAKSDDALRSILYESANNF